MRRKIPVLILLICIPFYASCKNYVKTIRKTLKIEHVFSRPALAYGPGSVVMYEKKSGYTGVCLPQWVIGNEQPIISEIPDYGISQNATINFKIDLDAKDLAKIEAEYHDISEVVLDLKNGHQAEIITDLEEAFNRIGSGTCGNNCEVLKKEHPKSRFYFIRVAYAYDLKATIKRKNGLSIGGEIPQEVLKLVAAKIGMGFEQNERLDITGEKLYIGFNGTPRKIKPGFVSFSGPDLSGIKDHVIDVTDILK